MEHHYFYREKDISIVPLSEVHSEKYRQLRNRDDNRKWFKTDLIITQDMQKKWYQNYLTKPSEYMFAIEDNKTGEFIGAVGLYDINPEEKCAEIGRIIVDRFKSGGRGYASKALECACKIGVEQLGLTRIYAEIYSDNIASLRSFEKIGFIPINPMADIERTKLINMEKLY